MSAWWPRPTSPQQAGRNDEKIPDRGRSDRLRIPARITVRNKKISGFFDLDPGVRPRATEILGVEGEESSTGRREIRPSTSSISIAVTDIQPGFVDTVLARGEGLFCVASAPEAARQIYKAIRARRSHAYATKRWRLVAGLLKSLPDALYHRI